MRHSRSSARTSDSRRSSAGGIGATITTSRAPRPQLVEERRLRALLEGERDIGVCGQKRVEQPGYVARAAAVAEAQRDAAPVGIDDLLEVLSGSAQVDQRLLCRGQERAPSLGRDDSAPARLHQRGADRVGEAMHDGADGRLRHP